ncbi:substrate binding domain of ABC-type glycine betaine transport system family protein [Shigella boydii 5216-82]|nr:substrate binding domain of ABC-type glycine betaine transport system family protein [Shigella boydii 5216-82]
MPLSKVWVGSLVLLAAVSLPLHAASPVKVGSKIDTEGALLGNIILQVLESHGVPTVNKVQLGTTPVVRGAITSGELDIYPEYTGNGAFFFKDENDAAWKNAGQGYEKVKKLDAEQNKLIWLTPAPANNTWTIAVRQDVAEKNKLTSLADLSRYLKEGGTFKLAASAVVSGWPRRWHCWPVVMPSAESPRIRCGAGCCICRLPLFRCGCCTPACLTISH